MSGGLGMRLAESQVNTCYCVLVIITLNLMYDGAISLFCSPIVCCLASNHHNTDASQQQTMVGL